MRPSALPISRTRKSSLLSLPAELRNMIYIALFASETQCIRPEYTLPGLLTANKQIHHEAMAMYYTASIFRCLDEDSTVYWLVHLPLEYRVLIEEIYYDTRWIVSVRPKITIPGAEGWLWLSLCRRLEARGVEVESFAKENRVKGKRLKVSHYRGNEPAREIVWTERMEFDDAQ